MKFKYVPKEQFEDCMDCHRTSGGKSCPHVKTHKYPEGTLFGMRGNVQYCPKFQPEWVIINRATVARIIGLLPRLLLKKNFTADWAVEEAKKKGVTIRYSMTVGYTVDYPVFYMKVRK